jgi:hypothetical protein
MVVHKGGTQSLATMRMAAPWRDPKTGIWKLRKRVPPRFWPVAKRKIIKISTGTASRSEALRIWPDILKQWEAHSAEWERALSAPYSDQMGEVRRFEPMASLNARDADTARNWDSDMPKPQAIPECRQLRDAPKVPFQGIFDAWKAGATVKPRVAGDTRGIIDLFARFLGHDDAALVGRLPPMAADLPQCRPQQQYLEQPALNDPPSV